MRKPLYDAKTAKRLAEALQIPIKTGILFSLEEKAKSFSQMRKELRNYHSQFDESDYERLHRLEDIIKGRVYY